MAKIQLGVLFGSRSCEREVAIISAVQLMNHVDTEKYDVIPVYISEQGVWYTGAVSRAGGPKGLTACRRYVISGTPGTKRSCRSSSRALASRR